MVSIHAAIQRAAEFFAPLHEGGRKSSTVEPLADGVAQ